MSRRNEGIRRAKAAQVIRDSVPQPFIGLIVDEDNGVYSVTVNGRDTPRQATASNEFAFAAQGSGLGDEIILIGSDGLDLPTIVGLSPWMVHQ